MVKLIDEKVGSSLGEAHGGFHLEDIGPLASRLHNDAKLSHAVANGKALSSGWFKGLAVPNELDTKIKTDSMDSAKDGVALLVTLQTARGHDFKHTLSASHLAMIWLPTVAEFWRSFSSSRMSRTARPTTQETGEPPEKMRSVSEAYVGV